MPLVAESSSSDNLSPYDAGVMAGRRDYWDRLPHLTSNPYPLNSAARKAWSNGYAFGLAEERTANDDGSDLDESDRA